MSSSAGETLPLQGVFDGHLSYARFIDLLEQKRVKRIYLLGDGRMAVAEVGMKNRVWGMSRDDGYGHLATAHAAVCVCKRHVCIHTTRVDAEDAYVCRRNVCKLTTSTYGDGTCACEQHVCMQTTRAYANERCTKIHTSASASVLRHLPVRLRYLPLLLLFDS